MEDEEVSQRPNICKASYASSNPLFRGSGLPFWSALSPNDPIMETSNAGNEIMEEEILSGQSNTNETTLPEYSVGAVSTERK